MSDRKKKDPADEVAKIRADAGLSRLTQQERTERPHPGKGGSRGYDLHVRLAELARKAAGLPPFMASKSSVSRWSKRAERYRSTGNRSQGKLVGKDLFNMFLFVWVYPDASNDEIATFIFNSGGPIYSNAVISARMKKMHLTRKVASKEAYQAFTPESIWRAKIFWSKPPPLGVVGVPRRRFIDVDEFGMDMTKTSKSKKGIALQCFRARIPGAYQRTQKLTIILAVEAGDPRLPPGTRGSVENPRRCWVNVIQQAGTTAHVLLTLQTLFSRI